jgi:hypothetical protein
VPLIATANEPLRPKRNSRLLESWRLGSPRRSIATSAARAVNDVAIDLMSKRVVMAMISVHVTYTSSSSIGPIVLT